ncbi:hypothetical protein H6F67_13425 [Microcoleus sp. FACHB-1515]|uniref:hypothetical protein n=1 Tax=Cyanophyceae TaxID=3028117 RepID=UPI001685E74C|nr:hypothetical protein [Microcoleus sp. FACHB-1515]MBD2090851.1 hypothetical protein [Microcoleus sp. FACHB-1515]
MHLPFPSSLSACSNPEEIGEIFAVFLRGAIECRQKAIRSGSALLAAKRCP